MWNFVAFHLSKDEFVDEILSRYRRIVTARGRQRASDSFRQPAGVFGLILTRKQLAMRRFKAFIIRLRLGWLRPILLRQLCGDDKRQKQNHRDHYSQFRGFHLSFLLNSWGVA
jgi:hypothetical protein